MSQEELSVEHARHGMQEFWIRNNISFLFRYWSTAREALQSVVAEPDAFTEFQGNARPEGYVSAIVSNHLEHHNYSGVLLTYAILDEFMVSLAADLGRTRDAPISPGDLRDRGIKRYKKYVHKVCRIEPDEVTVDWSFLKDFAVVRNAIIHANGNKSLFGNPRVLEQVVSRHSGLLKFKHNGARLVVSDDYVVKAMTVTKEAALSLNDLTRPTPPQPPAEPDAG